MRKILTGLLLTSALTAVEANTKHNIIVGLGAGFQNLRTYVKQDMQNGTLQDTSVAGGVPGAMLTLGYRTSMGMFLGGLEFDVTTPATFQNKNTNLASADQIAYKIKAGWAFGGSILLGANVTDTAYAALRVGAEQRKYNFNSRWQTAAATANNVAAYPKNYSQVAFAPGVLLGTGFAGCWDVSADYRIRFGRGKTIGKIGANDVQFKLKDTNHTFMLKLGYKFGI